MRKLLVLGLMSCAVLLLVAIVPATASRPRGVTGGLTFQSPWFWFIEDPQIKGWMQINAYEVGLNGEATGMWQVQLYKKSWGGWRRLDGDVVRLGFGELNGSPVVAVLVQITRAQGWGTEGPDADPKVGEYGWSMFHDGGPNGPQSNDYFALQYLSMDPLDEYFPDIPANFGLWDPGPWVVSVINGNLTIHGE